MRVQIIKKLGILSIRPHRFECRTVGINTFNAYRIDNNFLNPLVFNGLNEVGIAYGVAIRRLTEILEHTDYDYENYKPNQEVLPAYVWEPLGEM